MKKILFVCTGNICRSPTAHAIARHFAQELKLEDKFYFDSCGLTSYHAGESPDARSAQVGAQNNISFSGIFSRKIKQADFNDFDLIMAMDKGHFRELMNLSEEKNRYKIKLFLEFCATKNSWSDAKSYEVVDPYYLEDKKFDEVFLTIEKAVKNLLKNCL